MTLFKKNTLILFSFICLGFIQCQFNESVSVEENDSIMDPIEIHSLMKSDTSHGITIVSLTENNPFKVREKISQYQIPEETFEEKRKKLYDILNTLEILFTFSEPNIYSIVDSMNYLAAHYLQDILKDPKSLYSPIRHKMLSIIHTPDRNIRVFSWDENAGMSFKTYINVFQYRTLNGNLNTCLYQNIDSDKDFNFAHAKIKSFYKLQTTLENALYLVVFDGFNCKTCLLKGITSLEITNDSLNFNYPLINDSLSYLIFDYTPEDKLELNYQSRNKILSYKWIQNNENQKDTIHENFEFLNNYFYKKD